MLILSASLFSRKLKEYKKSQSKRDFIETTACFSKNSINNCNMAGGDISGLTSQTFYPLSFGSDTISSRNPPRPHTNDRYSA